MNIEKRYPKQMYVFNHENFTKRGGGNECYAFSVFPPYRNEEGELWALYQLVEVGFVSKNKRLRPVIERDIRVEREKKRQIYKHGYIRDWERVENI